MVRRALGVGDRVALADDASDALAIALCHLFCARDDGGRGRRRASRRGASWISRDAGGREMIAIA